jgi:hypothetical protein
LSASLARFSGTIIIGPAGYNGLMPRPITDSPWFWAYLFATAALIALALMGPKYSARQAQIEREFQGRQRAAQSLHGQEPSVQLSSSERTLITLQPLFIGLAATTVIAWIVFWRTHRNRQAAT